MKHQEDACIINKQGFLAFPGFPFCLLRKFKWRVRKKHACSQKQFFFLVFILETKCSTSFTHLWAEKTKQFEKFKDFSCYFNIHENKSYW